MVNYRGFAKHVDDFSKEERAEMMKEPHHIVFYKEQDGHHYMIVRPYRQKDDHQ